MKSKKARGHVETRRKVGGGRPAKPTQSGKVATTRKSGTVRPRRRDEPKSVSFGGGFVRRKEAAYIAAQEAAQRAAEEEEAQAKPAKQRKDEISAAKAYLATIEREKRAKRARDEFKNYHKGAKKAVSTLKKGYEDLPIEARFKVEKNMNKLFDDSIKQSKQAKKNRARYEKKFKEEERDLPKKLPYESELIRGARLSLAEEILGAFLVAINETGEKKRATRAANKKMDKGFGSDAIKKKFELTDDEKSRADAAYEKDGHAGYITALGRIYQKRTGRGRRDPNERYP